MFTSARLKLTAWYLLIILLVSGLFSIVIYAGINNEYNHIEQVQKQRQEREQRVRPFFDQYRQQLQEQGLPVPPMPSEVDLEAITEARVRLQAILLLVNLIILAGAGFAGYFLAGRTLKPIKTMVDDQNRFITDASHELRTPLTSLKSEIEVYLRDKRSFSSSKKLTDAKKLLKSNLEEVNKLQYLSDNLIKLTQHQNLNNHSAFTSVSLGQVIDQAIKKVATLAKNKNITIISRVKDFKLEAEKQALTELFVILFDNAIKYSPPKTTITLSSKKTDHSIVVEVKDQGVGIDKKDLPHLFDRFYRADKSRSGNTGYGLGLSIAKQIIKMHQGTIKVASQVGRGTTFIITLPSADSQLP